MKRIAILGPGLLGGSLALKLRTSGGCRVAIWARRAAAVEEIRERGCADESSTTVEDVVSEADVVVFCVPVAAMPVLAREVVKFVKPGALVTDVGSVKARVVAELGEIFRGKARFVGSHPMAGSEFTGLKAADARLFDHATCIVTPDAATAPEAVGAACAFWEGIGCRVVQLAAGEHDACVALISHLPHVVAGALIHNAACMNSHAFSVVGPGFRDTTRVASGPPEMWVGILGENAAAVTTALDALIAKLTEFRHILSASPVDGKALREYLATAKETRDRINFPK